MKYYFIFYGTVTGSAAVIFTRIVDLDLFQNQITVLCEGVLVGLCELDVLLNPFVGHAGPTAATSWVQLMRVEMVRLIDRANMTLYGF